MTLPRQIKSPLFIFLHDLAWVPVAWMGAYWLRFNLDAIPDIYFDKALVLLPLVIVVQGVSFWVFGLYRGIWRFASMPDLMRIIKAVVSGALVSLFIVFLFTRGQDIPRSVFPLYALILLIVTSGPRFIYRWYKDRDIYKETGKRVLVVGAGSAGEMLIRDLKRDPLNTYYPVALVDDDRKKRGKEIHGVRVRGATRAIPELIVKRNIDIVLIALPSANSKQMRRIIGYVEKVNVPFRTLPRREELMSGQVSIKELKEVSIEDLLGREQAKLNWSAINKELFGKTVIVTGGGGSIGSELCRQIASLNPQCLVILDHSEHNLYQIDMELRESYPEVDTHCVLGDSGDVVLVDSVFSKHKPQVVFHAAAYKHVPILEDQVRVATVNNVLSSRTIADAADRYNCELMVLVSTDKAVNPANVMGMTKRVAEIYCQNLALESSTRFITVRFGNVLDSAGSVIPLFRKQIAKGGPVTVTHKDITRYFMTIPEAAQLIMQAAVIGSGGEIYVLDMGDPVKISYLAEQLIILSGKKPGEDIKIVYTGLRPGEKLYEELFHKDEKLTGTSHPKILLAASRKIDPKSLDGTIGQVQEACKVNDIRLLIELLEKLVPENTVNSGTYAGKTDQKSAVVYQLDSNK